MERGRRTRKRIKVSCDAEIVSGAGYYAGFVENISEYGMKWYQYEDMNKSAKAFPPGTQLKVKLKLPSGERLLLNCRVIWSRRISNSKSTNTIGLDPPPNFTELGMEIINPPPQYKAFLTTLQ